MTLHTRLKKLERRAAATAPVWPMRLYRPGEPTTPAEGLTVWLPDNGRDTSAGRRETLEAVRPEPGERA
jgi:hypothetical protein